MVLLICACLAWGLMGAGKQLLADTRSGVRQGIANVKRDAGRKAAQIRARGWKSPSRWALAGGIGAWTATKVGARLSRSAGRSIRTGWTQGWEQGRKRHAEFVARRQETEQAAAADWDASHGGKQKEETPKATANLPAAGPAGEHQPTQAKNYEKEKDMSVSGEANNIAQTREALDAIVKQAQGFTATVDQLASGLATQDVDPDTIGEVMEIFEATNGLRSAAYKALAGLNQRHGAMEEAVNATPHAAKTEFYKHS
jgi:hypothetical protein